MYDLASIQNVKSLEIGPLVEPESNHDDRTGNLSATWVVEKLIVTLPARPRPTITQGLSVRLPTD